jgi:hypothetical protein
LIWLDERKPKNAIKWVLMIKNVKARVLENGAFPKCPA